MLGAIGVNDFLRQEAAVWRMIRGGNLRMSAASTAGH
jgi:hypothetical protein